MFLPQANQRTALRPITYVSVGAILVLAYPLLKSVPWFGGVHLHTGSEVVFTLPTVIVGILALVRYYTPRDNSILFLGVGFLGTAFLDGYHAAVTSEIIKPLMPSDLPSSGTSGF